MTQDTIAGWRERASCRDAHRTPHGRFTRNPADGDSYVPHRITELAHAYCRSCPVRRECATSLPGVEGLVGGEYRIANPDGTGMTVWRIPGVGDE